MLCAPNMADEVIKIMQLCPETRHSGDITLVDHLQASGAASSSQTHRGGCSLPR